MDDIYNRKIRTHGHVQKQCCLEFRSATPKSSNQYILSIKCTFLIGFFRVRVQNLHRKYII
jgi:hypothetical protein